MHRLAGLTIAVLASAGACIAVQEGEGIPHKLTDTGGGGTGIVNVEAGTAQDARTELSVTDPHAVVGVEPPHGPFSGNTRAIVRGNGFGADARVRFGSVQADPTGVLRIDTTRLQVVVPPGAPGKVAVTVQNGEDESTSRTLDDAFTYDAFYAQPSSGPTTGGTIVKLLGEGTQWADGTSVEVGGKSCTNATVVTATEIRCTTAGPHGGGRCRFRCRPAGKRSLWKTGSCTRTATTASKGGYRGRRWLGRSRWRSTTPTPGFRWWGRRSSWAIRSARRCKRRLIPPGWRYSPIPPCRGLARSRWRRSATSQPRSSTCRWTR